MWFASHAAAFRTFFVVGGVVGLAATAMLVLCVHPRDDQVPPRKTESSPPGRAGTGQGRAR
jgi:hypothetical protein